MDYTNYQDSYDAGIITGWKNGEIEMDVDTLRGLLYGFTFTDTYAQGLIEDALSMDYWQERHDEEADDDYMPDIDPIDDIMAAIDNVDYYEVDTPQEHLLMEVLDSTGDGKTPETAICVIDVSQEYEYLDRKFPFSSLNVTRQELRNGVDCLYFEDNVYEIDHIYFDISRRFEVISQRFKSIKDELLKGR